MNNMALTNSFIIFSEDGLLVHAYRIELKETVIELYDENDSLTTFPYLYVNFTILPLCPDGYACDLIGNIKHWHSYRHPYGMHFCPGAALQIKSFSNVYLLKNGKYMHAYCRRINTNEMVVSVPDIDDDSDVEMESSDEDEYIDHGYESSYLDGSFSDELEN